MAISEKRSQKRAKVMAVLAAGTVLGVATTMTLASWNDSEWVQGALNGQPNIGTEVFEVMQNTTAPFDNSPANWANREDLKDAGGLQFSPGSLALAPGDAVYAPVAMVTVPGSLAAEVELQAAVRAVGEDLDPIPYEDDGDLLWDALQLRAIVDDEPFTCDESAFTGSAAYLIGAPAAFGTLDTVGAPVGNDLDVLEANAAEVQHYCFEVSLPSHQAENDDLQGRSIAPAWRFAFTSIAE